MNDENAPDSTATPESELLVRVPQQERSRRTLERLRESALELLDREGPDAVTVTAVAEGAHTSVGSFYARFTGKEQLIRYVGETALEEAFAGWRELRRPAPRTPLPDRLALAVERLVELHIGGPAGTVVLLDNLEDPAPSRRRRLEDGIASGMTLGLADVAPSDRIDRTARFLLAILAEAARRAGPAGQAPGGEAGPGFPSPESLTPELVTLFAHYLDPEAAPAAGDDAAPSSDSGSEVDPFDVWA